MASFYTLFTSWVNFLFIDSISFCCCPTSVKCNQQKIKCQEQCTKWKTIFIQYCTALLLFTCTSNWTDCSVHNLIPIVRLQISWLYHIVFIQGQIILFFYTFMEKPICTHILWYNGMYKSNCNSQMLYSIIRHPVNQNEW